MHPGGRSRKSYSLRPAKFIWVPANAVLEMLSIIKATILVTFLVVRTKCLRKATQSRKVVSTHSSKVQTRGKKVEMTFLWSSWSRYIHSQEAELDGCWCLLSSPETLVHTVGWLFFILFFYFSIDFYKYG